MLGGKRVKSTVPAAGVGSGLSSSSGFSDGDKKLRGEGDGQIPHAPKKEHVKTKAGNFVVC